MEPMCCIFKIGLLVGSRMEPMCCIFKIGLLVRFKDGTNVLYT